MPVLALLLLAVQENAAERQLLRDIGPSIVALRSKMGVGSGFVVDAKGYILTNAHVATAPLPFLVEAQIEKDGQLRLVQFKKALLAGVHPDRDLALVKIDPAEHDATLRPLRFSGREPAIETAVFAIGFPHGGADKVLTGGKVTATDRLVYRRPYLEMDAVIHPGNSGGPVCLADGSVVGVVTLKDNEADTGLAIPAWEFHPQRFVRLRDRPPDPAAATELMNDAEKFMRKAKEKRSFAALACAVQLYEEASTWDPGNGELLVKMGIFEALGGQTEISVAYIVRGIQINAWPAEKGPEVYLVLAGLLAKMARFPEAMAVALEGFSKYPDRSKLLFDILAASAYQSKLWAEAARWSNLATKQGSEHPEEMNRILQESRKKLTPQETSVFLEEDATIDARMVVLTREAAAAEKAGTAAITPKFRKFLETFDGVQREGGAPLSTGGGSTIVPDADLVSDDEVTRLFLDAQLKVAREHLRAGRLAPAREALQDIVKTSPTSPQAKDARTLLDLMKK